MWQLKSSQRAVGLELSYETKDFSQNQHPQVRGNYGNSVSAHTCVLKHTLALQILQFTLKLYSELSLTSANYPRAVPIATAISRNNKCLSNQCDHCLQKLDISSPLKCRGIWINHEHLVTTPVVRFKQRIAEGWVPIHLLFPEKKHKLWQVAFVGFWVDSEICFLLSKGSSLHEWHVLGTHIKEEKRTQNLLL